MTENLDLAAVFQAVSQNLAQNQQSLNQADAENHNHGDNMVKAFELISGAVAKKKGADTASQLAYAAQVLSKKGTSGSAKVYAEGLSRAAGEMQGKQLNPDSAMTLISALMGAGAPASQSADSTAGDPTGGLLGALLGGSADSQNDGKVDMQDVLNIGLNVGMGFLQAKQQGRSTGEALLQSIINSSQMAQSPHRSQSASIVGSTLMSLLGGGK